MIELRFGRETHRALECPLRRATGDLLDRLAASGPTQALASRDLR